MFQDEQTTVEATAVDSPQGIPSHSISRLELDDDAVTHAVLSFDEDELQQRTITVRGVPATLMRSRR